MLLLASFALIGCGKNSNLEEVIENASRGSTTTTLPDTTAPSAPVISSPAINPYYSDEILYTLSGTCEPFAVVRLSGDDAKVTTCSELGVYSFSIYEIVDGTYVYQVKQTDESSNVSSPSTFTWYKSVVAIPTVTSPATSPFYSNLNSLILSGSCDSGNTVLLSGSSSQTAACSGNLFSFTVTASADASLSYSLIQENASGDNSPAVTRIWVRDTVAPGAPTVTSPSSNPYISSDSDFFLIGACETGATVSISGDATDSVTCESSTYSLTVGQTTDGTYDFVLSQTDRAGNASPGTNFQWIRDTSIPPTPTLSSPTSNPFYSKLSSVTISGDCITGNDVLLSGASTQTMTCAASAFSFSDSQSVDNSYSYSILQVNPNTMISSAPASMIWIRDTVAPNPPTILSPSSSPYSSSGNLTISGECESDSSVKLSGSDTQTVSCVSLGYSFTIVESSDATYGYVVSQTDLAGNDSTSVSQTWVRDSTIPAAPTITTPATSPYKTNSTSLTISGACVTGYTVSLSGDVVASDVTSPAASLTQICASSSYSFVLGKASEGTYNFNLKQTSLSFVDSGSTSLQWVLDLTAPETTLSVKPSDPNLGTSATFSFTANETGTFACSIDGGAFATCTSPHALSSVSNGSHTMEVRATDGVGNTDATPASYTWNQMSASTLALYHMDSADPTLDSGGYSSPYQNTLSDTGSTNNITGKFSQARTLNGTNQFLSAPHNAALAQAAVKMTAEAFIQVPSLPTDRFAVISKNGASGQYGWEMGIKKLGANYRPYFIGSLDGTTVTEVTGSNLSASQKTAMQTGFVHFAVTWDQGSVKIYIDGTLAGTGTIGSGAVMLYDNSSTSLVIGASNDDYFFAGSIDEVRISQVVRWTGAFTPPTTTYTAD